MRSSDSTPAAPTPSSWRWPGRAWRPRRNIDPATRAWSCLGLTAYLRGVEGRLRDAELATVRAEARAAGERRRRQLTLALAASVLITGSIGAAGWGWMDRERRRRLGAVEVAVNAALADSGKKREKAIAAGSDPILWVEAIEAARRAETLLAGNDASLEQKERVRRFLDELVREREAIEAVEKDRRIVERLAAVLNDFGVHGDERKANSDYAAAFRAYGVDVDSLDPSAAGRLLAASPVAPELASALDQWAILRRGRVLHDPAGADRLVAVARAADPDPWRNRLRDTVGRMGGGPARRLEVLERLAATADVEHLPVTSVTRLATSLAIFGRRDTAIALLRRAQASHRDDFWVNADLGRELMASNRPEEAVRFYAVAAGVRPQSPLALGGLGRAILLSGQPAEAADLFRQWTRLRPEDPLSHVALGSALLALGESSEAHAEFSEAKRLKPKDWMVRDQIALAFSDRGDWDAAIREQREAVRLFPAMGVAHKALAHALQSAGRLDEAVAEFREAVRLDPRISASHLFLGRALIEAGEPRAALEALARIGPGPPPDPFITPEMLASRAEKLIALEPRLPAVMSGARGTGERRGGRVVRPPGLRAKSARSGGPTLGPGVRRVSRSRGGSGRHESIPGRTRRGPRRDRGRRGARGIGGRFAGEVAPPGGRVAACRPRGLDGDPGFGDGPAASGRRPAAQPVAGRSGPGAHPRRAGPLGAPRSRAAFPARVLGQRPGGTLGEPGPGDPPVRARPKFLTDAVTFGAVFLTGYPEAARLRGRGVGRPGLGRDRTERRRPAGNPWKGRQTGIGEASGLRRFRRRGTGVRPRLRRPARIARESDR